MGASKRLAQLAPFAQAQPGGMVRSAMRFGNVLGSPGSVIPIFERQLVLGAVWYDAPGGRQDEGAPPRWPFRFRNGASCPLTKREERGKELMAPQPEAPARLASMRATSIFGVLVVTTLAAAGSALAVTDHLAEVAAFAELATDESLDFVLALGADARDEAGAASHAAVALAQAAVAQPAETAKAVAAMELETVHAIYHDLVGCAFVAEDAACWERVARGLVEA